MIDPTNMEAWEELSRVRWHMEPATTVWTLDGGVFVDTNPIGRARSTFMAIRPIPT